MCQHRGTRVKFIRGLFKNYNIYINKYGLMTLTQNYRNSSLKVPWGIYFFPTGRFLSTDHGFINQSTSGFLSFFFKIPGWGFNKVLVV